MAAPTYWTAEMVRELPEDGNRYEVVYGELLVTPAPRPWHEILFQRLIVSLDLYLRREPVGIVLGSRADISWSPDVLVQPDVFVVPIAQARTLDWTHYRDLLLVVEVLSPSSARSDRFLKRRLYQEVGIPLYWVVDGDQHQSEPDSGRRSRRAARVLEEAELVAPEGGVYSTHHDPAHPPPRRARSPLRA